MLKVECESCKAPYQVDERRVPPTGLKMRCPKCGHTFLVTDPSKGAPPNADLPATKAGPPPKKATMVGLAPKPGAPPPKPAGPPQTNLPDLDFGDVALPATKPAAPKPGYAAKPAAPPPPVPAAPPPGAGPPPFGGLDDLDLPSLASDAALPAAVHRPPPGRAPAAAAPPPAPAAAPPKPAPVIPKTDFNFDVDLPAVPPPAAAGGGGFGSVDLPATKGGPRHAPPTPPGPATPQPIDGFASSFGALDLPATKPAAPRAGAPPAPAGPLPIDGFASSFGALDLPAAKPPAPAGPPPSQRNFGSIDLPSPAAGGGRGDLPALSGGGFGDLPVVQPHHAGLPAPKAPPPGGFGELDLPALQNDLPLHSGMGGANLPAAANPGAHLPASMGAGAHLPTAMGGNAHLPTAMGGNAHLPSAMGGNAHLPSSVDAGAHLPAVAGAQAHLPSTVGDDRLMPGRGGPQPVSFGEIDLPLVGAGGGDPLGMPPPRPLGGGDGFGEVDLPADTSGGGGFGMGSGLPPLPPPGGGQPLGFGEVDLGGGADLPPIAPPVAMSGASGSLAFNEASLDGAPRSQKAPQGPVPGRLRDRSAPSGPPSKALRIAAVAVAVIVVGGAALQLTPVGAFGHVWISDRLHSGENAQMARDKGDFARKKLALDTFTSAQQAADDLVDARKRAPRSRPLGAYAAFVEYMKQVRFGADPQRAGIVGTYLSDIPKDVEVSYLHAARAAEAAQASDWEKARTLVDVAIAKEPKDGIQHELSILKGEVALAQKDPTGALAAFNAAHVSGGSARTFFGIARAHYMAKALPKAREAVDATLKASPTHNGALTLRAQLLWEMQRDDAAATKDLAAVLDEKNRKNLGPAELSFGCTTKGWIMFARDRNGEARSAFDEAVKIDPRNVSALIGQGEVLYADGRFTDALSRFGEALNKDPNSIAATVGSAKSKVSLEQLADAKTQLQAARQKAPKDMSVALWLARVEDALGNKKAAEQLYSTAVDLATPENPEAIQAYAAFAKFLAAQGKTAEAQAKMDAAKAKLPDSAPLQRAFGDVADAQGQFPEAVEHYENALKLNPGDLGTRFRLGTTYLKQHKLKQAEDALNEVAAIDKEYPGLSLQRGILLEQSGDLEKALEQFNGALQKDPKDVDLMMRVGAAYVSIGEIEKAMPLLNKVKDARPNSAEANHFLGRAYLRQGGLDQTQALRYLQRAVALDPNKAEYHLYVAWAANDASQLGLARAEIDKALSLDKLLADAYWQRGVLLRKESQVNDAIKDLKHALELKPSRLEAHAALAEAYENKNDTAASMAEWQKAIAGNDKVPLWRWQYGKILSNRNQFAEASGHLAFAFEEGKKLQPRPAWVVSAAFEAGESFQKTGKKKEACEAYKFFLDTSSPGSADRRDAERGMAALACSAEN